MSWDDVHTWHITDPACRPDCSTADGFLGGMLLSLDESRPDDATIVAEITGPTTEGCYVDPHQQRAAEHLKKRLAETREALAAGTTTYAPLLATLPNGEFDLTAWATGFIEALAPALDLWAYHLHGKPESGLLALLSAHAAGPMGQHAKNWVSTHPDADALHGIMAQQWELIPDLLRTVYGMKLKLVAEART
jgi:hypothetical protein